VEAAIRKSSWPSSPLARRTLLAVRSNRVVLRRCRFPLLV
jgi:hypothetical protein